MTQPGAAVMLLFVVLLGGASRFKEDDLPPDPEVIATYGCRAHDNHKTVTVGMAHTITWKEVQWLAEASATYKVGHEPAMWPADGKPRVIAMTLWEPLTQDTDSKLEKMNKYCMGWTKQVQESIKRSRKERK